MVIEELSAGKLNALSYLVGVYLTDGHATCNKANRSYLFIVNSVDKDWPPQISVRLQTLLGRPGHIYERVPTQPGNRRLVYRLEVNSKDMVQWLLRETMEKLTIPQFIWGLGRVDQLAFLAGAMDGDGWISYSSKGFLQIGIAKSEPWISELPRLLDQLGIKHSGIKPLRQAGRRTLARILMNKYSFKQSGAYFTIGRKQTRLEQFNPSETIRGNPNMGMI